MSEFLADAQERSTILKVVHRRVINRLVIAHMYSWIKAEIYERCSKKPPERRDELHCIKILHNILTKRQYRKILIDSLLVVRLLYFFLGGGVVGGGEGLHYRQELRLSKMFRCMF